MGNWKRRSKRILIIRLGAIGDIILTTPLIRMLKKKFPDSEIDFLVKKKYESLIRNSKYINTVISYCPDQGFTEFYRILKKIRERRYDLVIDLQSNIRSTLFRLFSTRSKRYRYKLGRFKRFILVHLRQNIYNSIKPVPLKYLDSVSILNIDDDGSGAELEIDEEAKRTVSSELDKKGIKKGEKFIVLAPGAGRLTKRWTIEGFAEVGDFYQKKGCRVVLVGGKNDVEVCKNISQIMKKYPLNFSGNFSIQETAALIDNSDLIVTNDTGVMHIGSALSKKVVAVFGSTTSHFGFYPFRTYSTVVERSLRCRPCSYHGTDKCPRDHFRCMKDISSTDVINAAEELLKKE